MTTFISYSRSNSDFAVRLYRDLKDSGFDVWLDQIDIGKGSRWDDEVERALKECNAFLIILSPESIHSQNVKDEVGYAIDTEKQILPILLKPCDIPLRLRRFQFVDFASKSYEESLVEIKRLLSINKELITSTGYAENSRQAGTQISTIQVSNQGTTLGDPKIRETSKPKTARSHRRWDPQVIIALIGLMGTVIAAFFSSPLFEKWFGSEPAITSTATVTIDGNKTTNTSIVALTLYPSLGDDVVYDFSDHICEASWFSNAGALPCPGTDGDENGFVLKASIPRQESGEDYRTGILTVPQNIPNGYIQGIFKPLLVQDGDQFRATISCENGSQACYVAFRLDYQTGTDPIGTLWNGSEKSDNQSHDLDIPLSAFAGKNIKFILSILSEGSPINDRALWIAPRIIRPCKNAVEFIADVSVPNGTVFSPSEKFTRTIRLKNTGTCTWTTDYALNFVSGDDMSSPASINLSASVTPSQIVDIPIHLQAPFRAGSYRGYWKLEDPRTGLFGDGSKSDEAFEVDIRVADKSTATP